VTKTFGTPIAGNIHVHASMCRPQSASSAKTGLAASALPAHPHQSSIITMLFVVAPFRIDDVGAPTDQARDIAVRQRICGFVEVETLSSTSS
jgi:hypothetical protein